MTVSLVMCRCRPRWSEDHEGLWDALPREAGSDFSGEAGNSGMLGLSAARHRLAPANCAALALVDSWGRRAPCLPAWVDGEEARRSWWAGGQICPGAQVEAGRDRLPPRLVAEQPAEHFPAVVGRAADELGRSRMIGRLPAEIAGDPQHGAGVRQRRVRCEAVEEENVTGLVAGRGPAWFRPAERARRLRRPVVTARQHGQPAQPDRYLHQRQPAGQHVLAAADPVVIVNVAAAGAGTWPLWVDGAQHLDRVGERGRAEYLPHRRAQWREIWHLIELRARQRRPEGGI